MVERGPYKTVVPGSNPGAPINFMPELFRENLEKQPTPSEGKVDYLIEKELIEESIEENKDEKIKMTSEKWINKHGEGFREIIEKPYIVKLLKIDTEKAKQKIKKKLYEEKIH